MSNLFLITGPAGVGKSTISSSLAACKTKSVLIEGDDIYHQVVGGYVSPWMDGNHLDVFWKVCIETINIYLNHGYDVIFNYILDKENLNLLKNTFKNKKIKFICLLSSKETLIKRDKQRPIDCQMKERCLELLQEFIDEKFNDNNILYTDNLSVEDVVSLINDSEKYLI